MELTDFLGALVEHNATNNGYQVQLNSGNLEDSAHKSTDVEFGDLYFTECSILNKSILCFGNSNRKPIDKKEDGTNLYPMEINSSMFIDLCKIECVEEVEDFEDCCTIFVAKHPVTKPNINVIKGHEKNLDEKIDELVKVALETKEIIHIR